VDDAGAASIQTAPAATAAAATHMLAMQVHA
jgi:hypothetical protein